MENVNTIAEHISKLVRNRAFHCHLSPVGRQMAIKNTVSNDLNRCSLIVKSIFDCRISGVILFLQKSQAMQYSLFTITIL